MNCPRCGKKVVENAKYCHNCGFQITDDDVRYFQRVKLRCKECGATMEYEPDGQQAVCSFCGSKELIIEDTEITVERIKSKTARDIRQLDYKQFKEKKELELEKLYYEENKKVRENKRDWQEVLKGFFVLGSMLLAIFLLINLWSLSTKITGKIPLPSSTSDYIGENYTTVEMELRDAGFNNITLKPLDDLENDAENKNGTVYKIMIDGVATPTSGLRKPNAKIIIYYHSIKGEKSK